MKKVGYSLSIVLAIFFVFSSSLTADDSVAKAQVSIVESSICKTIENHDPVEIGENFAADVQMVYCYSKIKSDADTLIKHIWYLNEEPVAEVNLNIGASSGWRTFSSKNITPFHTGAWRVDIVDADNTVLGSNSFTVN